MIVDSPELMVPAKCTDLCATQCDLATKYQKLGLLQDKLNHLAQHLVGDEGAVVDGIIDAFVADRLSDMHLSDEEKLELAEEMKTTGRKSVGTILDQLDESLTTVQEESTAHALSCNGILRMRAARGDVSYQVNVCTSQNLYVRGSDTPSHVPTHIFAKDAN